MCSDWSYSESIWMSWKCNDLWSSKLQSEIMILNSLFGVSSRPFLLQVPLYNVMVIMMLHWLSIVLWVSRHQNLLTSGTTLECAFLEKRRTLQYVHAAGILWLSWWFLLTGYKLFEACQLSCSTRVEDTVQSRSSALSTATVSDTFRIIYTSYYGSFQICICISFSECSSCTPSIQSSVNDAVSWWVY